LSEVTAMDNYQLRSEILSGGAKYYIQSNLVPNKRAVVTSLFFEGRLLSTRTEGYDPSLQPDAVRTLVRCIHEERKVRITSLLAIREQLKKGVDPRAHLKLGQALHQQKLYKEAMAEVIRAIKLGMEHALAYSILGNCLLATEDCEKALKAFQKGIEISPDYPDLHNDLGRTYLKLERCREAVDAFEKALDINKYYQSAFLNLAVALSLNVVLKQNYDLSRELHSRMRHLLAMNIQLRPSFDGEGFQTAVKAVDDERYDVVHRTLAAIQEEQERIALDDLSLELYLIVKFRGDQLTEDEIDRYIGRLQTALESNPGYADLQNDLGILFTAKCKLLIDRANESFEEALAVNPKFKKAEKNLKLVSNDRQGIHFLLKALLD